MDPPLQNQLRGESDSESGEGEVEGRLRPLRCQWDVVSAVRWVSGDNAGTFLFSLLLCSPPSAALDRPSFFLGDGSPLTARE